MFTALRLLGRDVEMVRFAGEGHGMSRSGRPHNRIEHLRRITDWLDRKL
jgi:dipeptidyl aminopeptidase/acylaminoacyl peptidase